jgi:hypothetical protein
MFRGAAVSHNADIFQEFVQNTSKEIEFINQTNIK